MQVIPLAHADRSDLAGNKATGLARLLHQGERVPPGFVITAGAAETLPAGEITRAYHDLGGGPVAVRSSATTEDLPGATAAGQHETFLHVDGAGEVLAAVTRCRESLHSPRARAYRHAHPGATPAMAVIVQRMIAPSTAGVLFTADPLTGTRTRMLAEAVPGLGAAVVDGTATPDRYVLGRPNPYGCLPQSHQDELAATGRRIQQAAGEPQDIEWAYDGDGVLWLLQARPVTTLLPLPPSTADFRAYLEFGHVQGMLPPVTPMGMSTLKQMIAAMTAALGMRAEIVDIGGRLYGDLTDLARHPTARKRLVKLMAVDFGPRAQAAMEHILADPRFAPRTGRPARTGNDAAAPHTGVPAPAGNDAAALRTAARALAGIIRALARPDAARRRLQAASERLKLAAAAPAGLHTSDQRLAFVRADDPRGDAGDITWPIVAGLLAATLPQALLRGLAEPAEIHTVLSGLPHNVTLEMDLALWRLARDAAPHRELLLTTAPATLAARHLRGELPDLGLGEFLSVYGHRGPAEADLGVPRWAEDPSGVFAAIANYLRLDDPAQAPEVRFARTAEKAEAALLDLTRRARRRRPVRGSLAVFLLRRARALMGLRETGKFAGLHRLRAVREQLLLIGADLVGRGLLAAPGDVMFLDPGEVEAAVRTGADHRGLVVTRRQRYDSECRRRHVPVALLSDGTDVEAAAAMTAGPAASPGAAGPGQVLRGVGASAGRATGPARIVHDPATAHIEPGDILVVTTTDPAWTPLFLTAAALVSETGAIMAHGPTVAREYGLPAVISVPGATTRIPPGHVITVDGAAGVVTTA